MLTIDVTIGVKVCMMNTILFHLFILRERVNAIVDDAWMMSVNTGVLLSLFVQRERVDAVVDDA
jgi:uncharacterized membrane protein